MDNGMRFLLLAVVVALVCSPALAAGGVDDTYTKSLLHFNGIEGTSTFTDEGGKTWVSTGAVLTSNQSIFIPTGEEFDPAVGFFNGAANISTVPHADFNFTTGDYTVDAWVRSSSLTIGTDIEAVFGTVDSNLDSLVLYNGKLSWREGATYHSGGTALANNTWYHVAVSRSSGTSRLYLNGQLDAQWTDAGVYNYTRPSIGKLNSGTTGFKGWIEEVRVTKGLARYTANFSVPTAAYEPYTGVTEAIFSANATRVPKTGWVQFTDSSLNVTSWSWLISWYGPEGSSTYATSTEKNPLVQFTSEGNWTVRLNVTNVSGFDREIKYGYIRVYSDPFADFEASVTSGSPALLVTFDDLSLYTSTTSLSYNWSFGDGAYSTTPYSEVVGDVQHLYLYEGQYTVALNVTNDDGSSVQTKENYILVRDGGATVQSYPQIVTIYIKEAFGAPIPEAEITMTAVETTTGSWDWIVQLFGIPLEEVPIYNETMTATTDTFGTAAFYAIPTVKYNITVVKGGYTFPTMVIAPSDEKYYIYAVWNTSSVFGLPEGHSNITTTVSAIKINSTAGFINVSLVDTESSVTGGTITVYADNTTSAGGDRVAVATFPITGSTCSNSTIVTLPGTSPIAYRVNTNATSSLETENIILDSIAPFTADPLDFMGIDAIMMLWAAMFIVMLVAMMAGGVSGAPVSIAVSLVAWVFFGIGWLDALAGTVPGGMVGVGAALSAMTFVAILWNVREGKRKEKF